MRRVYAEYMPGIGHTPIQLPQPQKHLLFSYRVLKSESAKDRQRCAHFMNIHNRIDYRRQLGDIFACTERVQRNSMEFLLLFGWIVVVAFGSVGSEPNKTDSIVNGIDSAEIQFFSAYTARAVCIRYCCCCCCCVFGWTENWHVENCAAPWIRVAGARCGAELLTPCNGLWNCNCDFFVVKPK